MRQGPRGDSGRLGGVPVSVAKQERTHPVSEPSGTPVTNVGLKALERSTRSPHGHSGKHTSWPSGDYIR